MKLRLPIKSAIHTQIVNCALLIVHCALCIVHCEPLHAQQQQPLDSTYLATLDSLMEAEKVQQAAQFLIKRYEDLRLKEEMQFSTEGVLPLVRSVIMAFTERSYHNVPATFRTFSPSAHTLDYLPAAAPLATAWVLRAAGLESRSSLRRMATASALSVALTAGITLGLNQAVNEQSPDRHTNHAFPSGHAALAFASAAILSREFGHHSPWITLGSYTCATATQALRLYHNRHWANDIFLGASVGLVSTNLAYFISDQIYGAQGVNRIELRRKDLLRTIRFIDNPTGLKFLSGTEVGDRTVTLASASDEAQIKTSAAFSAGLELNYYLNPNFSIDAILQAATSTAKVTTFAGNDITAPFTGDRLYIYRADLAAHFSTPLSSTSRMGFRPLIGLRHTTSCQFFQRTTSTSFYLPDQTRFSIGFGIDMELLSSRNYLLGFTADYHHTFNAHFSNRYILSSFWKLFF